MNRRLFLSAAVAALAGAVVGASPMQTPAMLPIPLGEDVFVDWFKAARRNDSPIAHAECRYRVGKGEWQQRPFVLSRQSPVAWLVPGVGLDMSRLWSQHA